jgi:cell wall-associated NlpC family hydrolase
MAAASEKAKHVVGNSIEHIHTGHTEVQLLIDTFNRQAKEYRKAIDAMPSNSGTGYKAISALSKLAAEYTGESAKVVKKVHGNLTDNAKKINELIPAHPAHKQHQKHPTKPHHGTHPKGHDHAHGTTVHVGHGVGTVTAPTKAAATAVRAAVTQLGVPYVWAGETPGKGFDCSGLTQWAYRKAGISLPHYASSQTKGKKVSRGDLRPGDLVIFSGHVTMYVGHGQVIEAPHTGDHVKIVPLFTHISGDPFIGFYRPSE